MDPLRHVKPAVRAISAYTLAEREALVKIDQNENPRDLPEALKRRVLERALAPHIDLLCSLHRINNTDPLWERACSGRRSDEGAISHTKDVTDFTPAAQTPPRYTPGTAQTPLSPGRPPTPDRHRQRRHPAR